VKRTVVAVTVVCLLLPLAAEARFTLGDQGVRSLNLFGMMNAGVDYDLEAGDYDPAVSFNYGAIRLFLGGNLTPQLTYLFHHTFNKGQYGLLDCWLQWQPRQAFLVRAGQFKAPFGRFYNSSGMKLLFKGRDPIVCHCPKYQVGIAPGVCLFDGKVELNAGAFNGDGANTFNTDPNLMYSGNLVVAPLGPVPMDESGHPGFVDPVFAIVPGFYTNPVQVTVVDTLGQVIGYEDVTTTSYGGAAAFRYDYLAFDAGYYMKTVEDSRTDGTVNSTGLSVQAGYAVGGKFEPIVRFTLLDPDTDGADNEVTTIEAGFNYYLKSYSSRLGLNYVNESVSGTGTTAKSAVQLYYQFLF